MKRMRLTWGWWRSLRAQTILVMFLGLLISHGIALAIYADDRGATITRTEAEDMAGRIAGMCLLVLELPFDLRESVVRAAETSAFRMWLGSTPIVEKPGKKAIETTLEPHLRAQLESLAPREVRVDFGEWPSNGWAVPAPDRRAPFHRLAQTPPAERSANYLLAASISLDDDTWMNFTARIPAHRSFWPGDAGYYIVTITAIVLLLSVWLVRRVTTPLKAFAAAADRLGRDIGATPLPEEGPLEVMTAARAFNLMQARLQRLIEGRTQMLAAISHDMRTPITLLRLRAELLEAEPERDKFLETLNEMEAMIDSFLNFARSTAQHESAKPVDLAALVESLCDDLAEAGLPVEVEVKVDEGAILPCRAGELRRAFANLIDNAVKYGNSARVRLRQLGNAVEVTIDDDGPGIPADQLDQACQPFFRGDLSRGRETGGVGLGLSIAETIIKGHGGTLALINRPEGGLTARVTLPR